LRIDEFPDQGSSRGVGKFPSRVLYLLLLIRDGQPLKLPDDRNFYGIISSKMTKTDPKTKKNPQNPRKASRQSQECKKKKRKNPK
jgi:hypothetical protein